MLKHEASVGLIMKAIAMQIRHLQWSVLLSSVLRRPASTPPAGNKSRTSAPAGQVSFLTFIRAVKRAMRRLAAE
jgi:hypothetical protein